MSTTLALARQRQRAHDQSLLVDSLADGGAKGPVKDHVPKEKHRNMRQIFRSSCNCVDPQLSCVLPHQWESRTEAGAEQSGEWELKVTVLFGLGFASPVGMSQGYRELCLNLCDLTAELQTFTLTTACE